MSQNETKGAENQAPEQAEVKAGATEKAAKADSERKQKKADKKKSAELEAIEKLEKELAETKNMLLRTAAEYDNFKRRTEKEKADLTEYVKAGTVKQLLTVADNIKRAEACEKDSSDYVKGLEMITKQLSAALDKIGLEEIEAENKPFDPSVHEAVMHVEDDSVGENTVVQVLQTGYRLGSTVIRPAMVKVAN